MTTESDASLVRTDGAEADQASGLPEAVRGYHAFLLRKAAQRISELAQEALGPFDLTLRHFGVLSLVEAEPGHSQRTIGARLRIDRTTIVTIIDDLERGGLLYRSRGQDRRTYALRLTSVGAARLQQLRRLITVVHEEFLAPLSEEERRMLRELLLRLL